MMMTAEKKQAPSGPKDLHVRLYGVNWKPVPGPSGEPRRQMKWEIEKYILELPEDSPSLQKISGYLGRAEHYMRFVSEIWGDESGVFYY